LGLFLSCNQENKEEATLCSPYGIDTIPFSSDPKSNIFSLQAVIQEKPYSMIFDTGAPNTILHSKIPSKIITGDTVFFHNILLQPLPSVRVFIDTLQIGKIKIINKDSYLQRDLNFDGIIGQDIIGGLVWKLDLINRNAYVAESIDHFKYNGKGIPFFQKGGHLYIQLEFEGMKKYCIIDTGFGGFIRLGTNNVDLSFLIKKNPVFWKGISTMHVGNPFLIPDYSPHIDSAYYFTGNFKVGEIELKNEILELHHSPLNIIGMDFFARFNHFIIDYPNKKIYLGEEQYKSIKFIIYSLMRLNTKGVTFIPSRSKAVIGRVTPWAEERGINYLDTVLSIDGISVNKEDSLFYVNNSKYNKETNEYDYKPSKFVQLWNEFHFVKDTSVIEIKKGDSSKFFTLTRHYTFREMPDSIADHYIDYNLPLAAYKTVETSADSYYLKFKTKDLLPPNFPKQ
jgi:hypothetical protein